MATVAMLKPLLEAILSVKAANLGAWGSHSSADRSTAVGAKEESARSHAKI